MATIGDVLIRIGATTKQLEYDLKKAERSLTQSAQKFKDIGANLSMSITLPVVAAGAAAFKMASDYEESLNKVNVAFGESSKVIEDFSKTTLDMYGIASGTALDMAALFGDMATSMGLSKPAAADMSKSLVGLAGDLASFKNIALSEVQTALAGIFTGETESLKRLGIVMTEANVQSYALERGITKKMNAMTQAEKVALRYEYVLNATKNAQGDFARTSDGAANQTRSLSEQIKELGVEFGQTLLPIITPLIKGLRETIKSFSGLSDNTKAVIVAIAGAAAAMGPLLYISGSLIDIYKNAGIVILRFVGTLYAQAGATTTATAGTVGLSAAIRGLLASAGPYILALTAIAAIGYKIYENINKANKANESFSDITKEAEKNIVQQKMAVERLINVIKDETTSNDEKLKAQKKLNEIAPTIFKNNTNQLSQLKDLTAQQNEYNSALLKQAVSQAAQEKALEYGTTLLELEQKLNDERDFKYKKEKESASFINKQNSKEVNYLNAASESATKNKNANINLAKIDAENSQKRIANIQKEIQATKDKIKVLEKSVIPTQETAFTGGAIVIGGTKAKFEIDVTNLGEFNDTIVELNTQLAKTRSNLRDGFITEAQYLEIAIENTNARLQELINQGFGPTDKEVINVSNQLAMLTERQNDLTNASQIYLQTLGLMPGKFNLLNETVTKTEENFKNIVKIMGAVPGSMISIGNIVSGVGEKVQSSFTDIFDFLNEKFGEGTGKLASDIAGAVGTAFNTLGSIYNLQAANLDAYEEKQRKVIENTITNEDAKAAAIAKLEEDLAKKRAQLARKKAIADKAAAIFSATIAGATEVVKVLGNPILAGVVAGLVAAQIAAIAATPLPSLAIGTNMVKSDGMAMLHKGEAVVPADVVGGGFSRGGELYGRLSGIDLLLSNRYAEGYYKRIR
jgi:hypothetical protein